MESKLGNILGGMEVAETRLRAEKNQKKTEIEELKRAIIEDGETTGSSLHDGILVMYGAKLVEMPQIEANYERVQARLAGKEGQRVLVLQRWLEKESTGMNALDIPMGRMSLGVLSGESLTFSDYSHRVNCFLPTSVHASVGDKTYSRDFTPSAETGGLKIDGGSFAFCGLDYSLGTDLDQPLDLGQLSPTWRALLSAKHDDLPALSKMEIYIGGDEIDDWAQVASYSWRRLLQQLQVSLATNIEEGDK